MSTHIMTHNQQLVEYFLLAHPFSTYKAVMEAYPQNMGSIQAVRVGMRGLMKNKGYFAEVRANYDLPHTKFEYALSKEYSGEPRVICIDPVLFTEVETREEVTEFLREISSSVVLELLYYLFECRHEYTSYAHLAEKLMVSSATIQRWQAYAVAHGAVIDTRGLPIKREIKLIKFGNITRYRNPVISVPVPAPVHEIREQELWKALLNNT